MQDLALRGPVMPELLRDELLSEIFGHAAARWPDKPCLTTPSGVLTYAQVDERATAIARGLIREGIEPGHVVGLWAARGPDLLIAQIGIAKTGAAWLPFDAETPLERVGDCLADAGARALVAGQAQAASAEGQVDCAVLGEEDLVDPADDTVVDPRATGATPDTPAYLIYTSGSSGTPKGIAVSNRNICHLLRAVNEVYGIGHDDVVFHGASLAFDLSLEEVWVCYLVGATLFVATPDVIAEIDMLPETMEKAGVTVLDTVPTLLALLPRDVESLRIIVLGGEACPPALADRWCTPRRAIFNSYGPTETTVVSTAARLGAGEPVTIGRPIPNYTCYVVDDALDPVAPGAEGELLIGGPGVAKGYLGRPQLTAEKFIANPFPSDGSDPVLYRSGDAVIVYPNGDIEFRGRIDDQVKIRGFRVELGEIEMKLIGVAGVSSAAVVMRSEVDIDQLVAFVVARADVDDRALRAALRATLPPYMIPARFERLAALPQLSSGKVDRKALKRARLREPVSV